ncbi:hypothetical protein TCAL_04268 [Tigriopus californicus]|uniref:HMG box-containing protein 1 n=1 Tax=Tigriopus californicus TaxID=6832 RepID=A0A553PKH8_TIGCA|nr:hypothetical protein TCAL_04268 [Tigriopus californicus]
MMEPMQDKPEDLSMKSSSNSNSPPLLGSSRKIKPIPPPLDLNARTLDEPSDLRLPKSPGDLPRECLPIRKRPLLEVRRDLHDIKSPKSAGPNDLGPSFLDFRNVNTAPSSPLGSAPPRLPFPSSTLSLTPSSGCSLASSNSAFTHFPVPPLIKAHALAAVSAGLPKSPFLTSSGNGYPTPPTDLPSPFGWNVPFSHQSMFSSFSPVLPHSPLPFPSTALLSPAPSSYPSSTNSSREDLPHGAGTSSATTMSMESESKRRYLSASSSNTQMHPDSTSPVPSSPLISPRRSWSHAWPTPKWLCFVSGTMIKFLIPTLDTPWQQVEELALKDLMAKDCRNPFQYAPNGLTIVKIDVISHDPMVGSGPGNAASRRSVSQDGVVKLEQQQQQQHPASSSSSSSTSSSHFPGGDSARSSQTLLILRMAPHREDNATELLAETALDHPFYVKERGWCSIQPRMTSEKYGIPCQEISVGDVCIPPNHPEAVKTPDLSDRLRRFEFDDPQSPLARNFHQRLPTSVPSALTTSLGKSMMSPPISPAKKKEKDPEKPKRPMNGFMLFAKKFRLELIQQHPGKDNRAISVLLGEAWKGLPQEERENYSHRAKLMAEEQKKLHPDCWKRKRTINNTSTTTTTPNNNTINNLGSNACATLISCSRPHFLICEALFVQSTRLGGPEFVSTQSPSPSAPSSPHLTSY